MVALFFVIQYMHLIYVDTSLSPIPRIKASDKISTSQVPLPIPVYGGTFSGFCVLVPSSRRRSLQACRVVNPVELRILFAPTLLLVDVP